MNNEKKCEGKCLIGSPHITDCGDCFKKATDMCLKPEKECEYIGACADCSETLTHKPFTQPPDVSGWEETLETFVKEKMPSMAIAYVKTLILSTAEASRKQGIKEGIISMEKPRLDAILKVQQETLSRHNLALVEAVKGLRKERQTDHYRSCAVKLGKSIAGECMCGAVDSYALHFNSALDAVIEIIKPKV